MNRNNNTLSIYNFSIILYCISLASRELLVSLGESVYFYLFLLYFIPLFLLCYEVIKYRVNRTSVFSIIFLIIYYYAFSAININGLKFFLPLVLAGVAFRNLDIEYIAKSFTVTQLLSLLIRFLLLATGAIQENEFYAEWKSDEGYAHDFGFGNPNIAGSILFFLNCMLFVVLYKKYRIISFLIILFITILSYNFTICRTATVSSSLLLLFYVIPNTLIKKLVSNPIVFIGLPLIIILLPVCFISFQLNELNQLLTGRLSYISYVLNQFQSLTDLFSGIYVNEFDGIPLDNVFAYLLVYGGILAWVIFTKFYMRLFKNRMYVDIHILIVILCIVASGIGESAWAVYGRFGSSFLWILLMNNTIYHRKTK